MLRDIGGPYAVGPLGAAAWAEDRIRAREHITSRVAASRSARYRQAEQNCSERLFAHCAFCDRFVDRSLDRRHIEARAALHRREVDQGLRRLRHFLLNEYETPEFVGEPVVIG